MLFLYQWTNKKYALPQNVLFLIVNIFIPGIYWITDKPFVPFSFQLCDTHNEYAWPKMMKFETINNGHKKDLYIEGCIL